MIPHHLAPCQALPLGGGFTLEPGDDLELECAKEVFAPWHMDLKAVHYLCIGPKVLECLPTFAESFIARHYCQNLLSVN